MSERGHPQVVSFRATRAEKALIRAAAEQEGLFVSELLHRIVVPAVRTRIADVVGQRS